MTALTQLGFTSAPLLKAIQAGNFVGMADLAEKAGRNKANTSRDLRILEDAGLVVRPDPHRPELTAAGLEQLAAVDRANAPRVMHDQIERDPFNPREDFDEEFIKGLAESIYDGGKLTLLQNLVIRPREGGEKPYRLVAGEQRWRAIGLLIADGRWPADLPVPNVIRVLTDEEAEVLALIENVQRQNLNAIDEARRYKHFRDVRGWSTAKIAEASGRSQKHVQNLLRCLELPSDVQERMRLPKGDERHIGAREARSLFQVAKDEPPKLELEPKLALALLELADKAQKFPAPQFGEVGFTELTMWPGFGSALSVLNSRKVIVIRSGDGKSNAAYAKIQGHSSGALAWLEARGFNADPDAAIVEARQSALSPEKLAEAETAGLYVTDYLNVGAAAQVEIKRPAQSPPSPTVRESEESATTKRWAVEQQARESERDLRSASLTVDLPDTLEGLLPYARQATTAYDTAQRTMDERAAEAAAHQWEAYAWKMNGGDFCGSGKARDELSEALRAELGAVPIWGQRGRFLLQIDGMLAAVQIKDNFGWGSMDFYAAERDQPFFSSTGYRSDFFRTGTLKTHDGADVATQVARRMRLLIAEYMQPRKPKPVDRDSIDTHLGHSPWIGELLALGKVIDGAALIEEHEAAVQARQDAAEANPVRQEAEQHPASYEPEADEIWLKASREFDYVRDEIERRPTYAPSQTHLFLLADRAVKTLWDGEIAGFLAIYARMLTAANPGQCKDELRNTFKRLGVDHRTFADRMAIDAPGYFDSHQNCHGVVTVGVDGQAVIAADPRAHVDAEVGE